MKMKRMTRAMMAPLRSYEIRRLKKRLEVVRPFTAEADGESIVLFFAPDASIRPHHRVMCFLARTLEEAGIRTLVTSCFNLFPRCPVVSMTAASKSIDADAKASLCLDCALVSQKTVSRFGVGTVDLRGEIDATALARVREALVVAPDDLREFTYEGIKFGKLCAIDFVLETKVFRLSSLAAERRRLWLDLIETSIVAYLAVDSLCDRLPVSQVLYFNDYAINLGARLAAKKHGVGCHLVSLASHRSTAHNRVVIAPSYYSPYVSEILKDWPRWRELPVSAHQVTEVVDDTVFRLSKRGTFIYSKPIRSDIEDMRTEIGLRADRKVVVAYTSSLDEYTASKYRMDAMGETRPAIEQYFADQIEWLSFLCDFAEGSDDIELVVRIHPREGVTHREAISSEHLEDLRAAFSTDRPNCHFIWPEDPISSYGLGEIADVALNSWSTIGLEMARLGVPVIAAFCLPEVPYPTDSFVLWPRDRTAYLAEVRRLLDAPPSVENLFLAFRWYSMINLGLAVNFDDVIADDGIPSDFRFRPSAATDALVGIVANGETTFEQSLARIDTAPDLLERRGEEARSMRRNLARLIGFLFTGLDDADAACDARWGQDGTHMWYEYGGRTWRRFSPMIARLARIHAAIDGMPDG